MVSGGVVQERKGWESSEKKREIQQGWERKTPASIEGLRVNLGRAAAAHCFSSCDNRELESNLHIPAVGTKGGLGLE
jgi:hypothetical protein